MKTSRVLCICVFLLELGINISFPNIQLISRYQPSYIMIYWVMMIMIVFMCMHV